MLLATYKEMVGGARLGAMWCYSSEGDLHKPTWIHILYIIQQKSKMLDRTYRMVPFV